MVATIGRNSPSLQPQLAPELPTVGGHPQRYDPRQHDSPAMNASWNYWLVAISVAIAIFASYTTFSIAIRIGNTRSRTAVPWLVGGATAMGLGIWSMHFVGMLAFRMPIPIAYDLSITLLSLIPAILASALALLIVRRGISSTGELLAGGAIIGTGIVAMHYTGMSGMQMVPPIKYDVALVLASWLLAVGAATTALALVFMRRARSRPLRPWHKLAGATIMGLAIAGMHYTGMAAAHYSPNGHSFAAGEGIGGVGLAIGVAVSTALILALAAIVSIFQERLEVQHEAATERLRRAYAELEQRVALRTQELRELSEELSRSNAELERFAYIVSHDLKEPLRSITGFSGLLQRKLGHDLQPDAKQYLDFIVDGARHMQSLIDGLLDYARAGASQEAMRPVDLDPLVSKVLTQLAVSIEEAGGEVSVEPLPNVQGDPLRLCQLFQNLIGNALKFRSEAPPRVHVQAEDAGAFWRLAVRDNGIGIDAKHRQRVFEVFQRLHGREEYAGTGIGLAICKKIVESHGGRIWIESEPGRGTTFFFTLPKAHETTPAKRPEPA
jgi:NO-binding membrane sensor protein with MHYT domain/nitrogen-specific signal transduction histidine kinase